MTMIHLHGSLKDSYGGPYDWHFSQPTQAVRLLMVNFRNFKNDFETGYYRVVVKHGSIEQDLDVNELTFRVGRGELHIIPVPEGSGSNGGTIKAVIGAVIIAVAVVASGGALGLPLAGFLGAGTAAGSVGLGLTYGSVALLGLAVALSGVAMMLAPTPQTPTNKSAQDDKNSFLLEGNLNTYEQGVGIPIAYGRCRVGAILAGSEYDTVQIMSGSGTTNVPVYSSVSVDPGQMSGLISISKPASQPNITRFRITDIAGGQLYRADGTTLISNGEIITATEAGTGVKYRDGWTEESGVAYRETRDAFVVQGLDDSGNNLGGATGVKITRTGSDVQDPNYTDGGGGGGDGGGGGGGGGGGE